MNTTVPQDLTVTAVLQKAIAHHQAGQLPEAEELYLSILQQEPAHPDANHNLGLMALQLDKAKTGFLYLEAAWKADPSVGQYWFSLTECLLEMGRTSDALLLIKEAIKRGIKSPQAQQLLMRAKGGNGKAQPSPAVAQEVFALSNSARYAELEGRTKPLVELYPNWALGWAMLGLALQGQGKSGESAFRRAVELTPNDAEAHNNLGVAFKEQGNMDAAAASFRKALKINPKFAEAHGGLGRVLQSKGLGNEAMLSLRQALKINPNLADAHNNMGLLLQTNGQFEDASACFRRAVKIKPDFAEAYSNLGTVLHIQGQLDAAVASLHKAIEVSPNSADVHYNLGVILMTCEQFDAALTSFRRALELKPDYVDASNNLGVILKKQGQTDAAIASFRQTLEIKPDHAEAHFNLAIMLQGLCQHKAALASIRRALEIKPDYADAHTSMGIMLMSQGNIEAAMASYRLALEIKPDQYQAHDNMGNALMHQGLLDAAQASFRRAIQIKPDSCEAYSNLLFCLTRNEQVDARTLLAEHLHFSEQFEASHRAGWPQHNNSRDPERCLQVGFVSGDLFDHPVASYIEHVLAHLAGHVRLSLHAYYNNIIDDHVTQRLRGYFAHWHVIAELPDAALADKIGTDGIDILIDLSGHTAKNRLLTFARKPAPVQASWIGYPGTTGLYAMDYYLADRFLLPQGEFDDQFTEKIVRLPANAPFLPAVGAPPVNTLPALINGYVTFGSFNHLSKLSRSVIALWSQLLRALPDSKMVLGAMPKEGEYDALIGWFAQEGIALERLSFYARSDINTYLNLHHQVDICLDSFPYNGGTTTLHALWMGVPTLTLAGSTMPGRVGTAVLGHVDLETFIAHAAADFLAKGLAWVENLAELSNIRAGLRERFANSAVGQPALIAAGLESALRIMWQHWCADLPPESFEVTQYEPVTDELMAINPSLQQSILQEIEQVLNQAVALHQAGQLQVAEELYLAILQLSPKHPDTNHNMGVLTVQKKQPEASLPYFLAALDAEPTRGQYWLSYIDALFQAGQLENAKQVLELARQQGLQGDEVDELSLRLQNVAQTTAEPLSDPEKTFPAATSQNISKKTTSKSEKPDKSAKRSTKQLTPSIQEANTLVALFAGGRYSEAIPLAQAMTEQFPLHGFGWKALGASFQQMGRNADALIPMQKSATLSPNDAEAHNNLGNILKDMGRLNEACSSYRRALKLNPDYAEAHSNLGNALKNQGQLPNAEASYRRAIKLKPDYAEAYSNLGVTLSELGRHDEAETSHRRALQIKPNHAIAYCNLGNTLKSLGRLSDAEASHRQALQIKPDLYE
jgi:protein O-GlcNAc transferase